MFAFSPQAFSVQAFSPAAFAIDTGGTQPAAPPALTLQALPSSRGGKRRLLSGREEARRRALCRQEDELLLALH